MRLEKIQRTTTSLEATNEDNTQATMFNTSSGYSLVEEQNQTQATNNIFNTSGDYSLISDTSTLLQLQQAQMSNIMSQSQVADLLWDVDEQRSKTIYNSGFNNL